MTINVRMQTSHNRLKPKITVIGVGGAGGNAVNNMISQLEGCDFLACNTDAQALENSRASHKIQLGMNVTRGLGAGANPEIGRAAAEESIDEILAYLEGSNMVFITAGMGGGTGTGAASVIAQAAREAGILTIGVVTKPFHFEGTHRMKLAEGGIAELQKHVDTLIIIPNQNLFRIANEKTTFSDAFRMADEVLQSGVRGVTDLMVMPGLINLDFADIRAVMAEMGKAMMGTGEAVGERRAVEAAEAAISNPLLDDVSMKGARGVLINITGGLDMTLFEVDEAANRIREEVDPDANIIFGSTFDESLSGTMRVSVVATGIEAAQMAQPRPVHLSNAADANARRPGLGQRAGGSNYAPGGYTQPSHQVREQYSQSAGGYGAGAIPSSILPTPQNAASVMASRNVTVPVAAATQAPVTAGIQQQPMMQQQPVIEQPQAPVVGQATTPAYTQTATARKLNEDDMSDADTWTKPVTQNYQRSVPPASQPRGQRVGASFIPPKPVDPRGGTAPSGPDLFGEEYVAAETKPAVEKAPKKSPSLFERFTMRKEEAPAAAKTEAPVASKLTVEDGGKQDEDELDIPAFLRRQAN
jgi:cell division protein FtsZ